MSIDIFLSLLDYKKYFVDQLILSSSLLGLLIATSIFLLQSGFASFKYSRSMFLKYYVRLTKFLFLLLGYNIILSAAFLYTNLSQHTFFIIHSVFVLVFAKYILDFYSHKGYIITINSTKFNPYKNSISKYFRYITNLGFVQVLIIFFLFGIVIIYPFFLGEFGVFHEKQGFVSTIINFIFCVFSLIKLIPQYFEFTEIEYKQKMNDESNKEEEIDLSQELIILKDTLIKNGRTELEMRSQFNLIDGEIQSRLADKKDEAFFVINLWVRTSDVQQIVRATEKYSYDFFKELNGLNVDINSFVLSFFISIEGVENSKTYFIRAKRTELEQLFSKNINPEKFVQMIKNKLIDELFRNV